MWRLEAAACTTADLVLQQLILSTTLYVSLLLASHRYITPQTTEHDIKTVVLK